MSCLNFCISIKIIYWVIQAKVNMFSIEKKLNWNQLVIMVLKKRIFPTYTKDHISYLSWYFRILMTTCLIPLQINKDKRTIDFRFTSSKWLFHSLILFIINLPFWLSIHYVLGFKGWWNYFLEISSKMNTTDTISMMSNWIISAFSLLSFLIFLKNLGSI